mmetsp:Transcript_12861/g.20111  ORF Transcript_12861/g.20111 Transcript_12861/m.20111 type:complete len:81 (+) Transcript_12861:789-1031(+)
MCCTWKHTLVVQAYCVAGAGLVVTVLLGWQSVRPQAAPARAPSVCRTSGSVRMLDLFAGAPYIHMHPYSHASRRMHPPLV